MKQCEVCGNNYDKIMEITLEGKSHFYDSFECAIKALAPRCRHCGVQILGHGLEGGGETYCCAHCARVSGEKGFVDRVTAFGAGDELNIS